MCPSGPPPPLSHTKVFVTEEILSPACAGGANFGAAQELWGCSLFVFFRNQSLETPSQGSRGVWKEQLCDSVILFLPQLGKIYLFLVSCCTYLLRGSSAPSCSGAARSGVAEGNLLVQIKIIKISEVQVRGSFWRGLRRRNPFSRSSGPPCVAAADPGFASVGNFWVDIRHFGKPLGWGTGWQQWGRALCGHLCSWGLSFPLCNEIMAGENAFFLPFCC